MDLLSVFTLCNLLSVMTHLRQGKKVSILPPGNVNPRLVRSRRGLLENIPYYSLGVACLYATSHDHTPTTLEPRDVLWSLPQDVNMFL
jgi:hypothetical protein